MTLIYIVDLETTGLGGGPIDLVVDVGICTFDTNTQKVEDVYSSHLGYDTAQWSDVKKNAWIFTHEGAELTVADVDIANGCPPAEQVIEEVRQILNGQIVTSYNTGFDLDRFLLKSPWYLNIRRASDIMAYAGGYIRLKYGDSHRPSLQKSYDWILQNKDPADINGLEKHLGLPDARMAAYVLKKMWYDNYYSIYG